MLLLRGFFILAVFGVWMYSIFDVIRSDAAAVRHLHKLIWLVLVLLFSPVGPLVWLFLGRPEPLGSRLFQPVDTPKAPDDSPEFLASLDDEIRRRRRGEMRGTRPEEPTDIDEEIRRLEDELRRRAEEERGEGNNPRDGL